MHEYGSRNKQGIGMERGRKATNMSKKGRHCMKLGQRRKGILESRSILGFGMRKEAQQLCRIKESIGMT
ncbi:hypothetical protein DT065_13525 [Salicibibacter kimchii]|uniref:Uncharacterized protein n=2 Tax=Salicibibacter kimchii TaxID=2099786 RepID=A0A345C140_9BACI|nr:hypothetical protein DT065_13525 [Salicibibacter kimchii]